MTETRVPAGVPTGGQFAASARAEATVSLDPAVASGALDVPGLDFPEAVAFRRLDAALRRDYSGDGLSDGERSQYEHLAARVSEALLRSGQEAYQRPELEFLDCPRHGGRWGDDPSCEACTDLGGYPLSIQRRVTVKNRLGPGAEEFLAAQKVKVARDAKVSDIEDALAAVEETVDTVNDHADGDAASEVHALGEALGDAWSAFDASEHTDTATYAAELERIADNELWEVAHALGYNSETNLGTARQRDSYLDRQFGNAQRRLTDIAARVRTLDEPQADSAD